MHFGSCCRYSSAISDYATISALNYLLIVPLGDILKGVDIDCLSLCSLENFVITVDEYIEVYDHHLHSRTKACAVLTRTIFKMPKLDQTIYGFMKVFPSLKEKVFRFDNRRDRNAGKNSMCFYQQ